MIIWLLGVLMRSVHTMGEMIKRFIVKVALAIKKCSTVMHGERRPHIVLLDIVLQKTFQRI